MHKKLVFSFICENKGQTYRAGMLNVVKYMAGCFEELLEFKVGSGSVLKTHCIICYYIINLAVISCCICCLSVSYFF